MIGFGSSVIEVASGLAAAERVTGLGGSVNSSPLQSFVGGPAGSPWAEQAASLSSLDLLGLGMASFRKGRLKTELSIIEKMEFEVKDWLSDWDE